MGNNYEGLAKYIDEIYDNRELLKDTAAINAIHSSIELLNAGRLRVAEKKNGEWKIHVWVKKAVLLSFALSPNKLMSDGVHQYYDKIDIKSGRYKESDFREMNIRFVPGSIVRTGSFIGDNVVLMPSFVNIGAYIDEGTMIDTWATVGSCAYVGRKCHISGGVGIGGVLEPLQSSPVIIEDNCFIGSRSSITEGVIVEEGCVIASGVNIGASTKIIDRATGEVYKQRIPAGSVVVAGTTPSTGGVHLSCAVIVKQVDAATRQKTSPNELLRLAV